MDHILEVCVDSVESAMAAAEGGATRLELCANLIVGGSTPGTALYKQVKQETGLCTHVLIRPRFGDFCYTEYEFRIMLEEIWQFQELGAEGVVTGVLDPDGFLDEERMGRLVEAAGDMSVTLHRAFDVCSDPFRTMEQAGKLGVNTILTSGQRNHCLDGCSLIRELVEREKDGPVILVGGGVDAEVIARLKEETGAHAFHMSGKKVIESPMRFRREGISMGLPGFSEYEIFRTSAEKIRRAAETLELLDASTEKSI